MFLVWVFEAKKKQILKDVLVFIVLSAIGLLINIFVMWMSVDVIKIHYMVGKFIAIFIVMIWIFATKKFFVEK